MFLLSAIYFFFINLENKYFLKIKVNKIQLYIQDKELKMKRVRT